MQPILMGPELMTSESSSPNDRGIDFAKKSFFIYCLNDVLRAYDNHSLRLLSQIIQTSLSKNNTLVDVFYNCAVNKIIEEPALSIFRSAVFPGWDIYNALESSVDNINKVAAHEKIMGYIFDALQQGGGYKRIIVGLPLPEEKRVKFDSPTPAEVMKIAKSIFDNCVGDVLNARLVCTAWNSMASLYIKQLSMSFISN